ncbi:hypothetical protein [Actinacidiphila glaucinigra]|uniref:Uncharacterized protein n=1 Tax=Actinacidiphila glaucinigra TaxID=235986 RepID=A0A239F1X1_9ACTN|nr:hypothetical protein [Actinacidiphila glaucinigra]SNS50142.1 hypothetical protein SAMN05216252_106238 [Actinacidiphila glaucinigra]
MSTIVAPGVAAYYLMLIVEDADGETTYIDHYLDDEPADVWEFIPEGWDLIEDESQEIIRGAHDCECCGMHVMNQRECDTCQESECDPAESWHCFTGYCDGTGCTFEGECEPTHEVRVWRENGDLMGHWEVEPVKGGTFLVTQREGYERDAESRFTSLWSAWQYAQGCAEMHAQMLREECAESGYCDGDDCGVMHEHGISVQEVTSNRDLARA